MVRWVGVGTQYTAATGGIRTHDLPIASPTLYITTTIVNWKLILIN